MTGWSHLTLRAEKNNLGEVFLFLRQVLGGAGIREQLLPDLELAVEEAVVNVMTYAYPNGEGDLVLGVLPGPDYVTIELRDRGTPFNPLLVPEPDITSPLGEREIGGLGVHLIRTLMDEVSYEYRDGENILTLRKRRD
ncbi:MAG: ATP-binding protein [Methanolinea sp.]|nr:ATP-binding protein [Methanolinea sp.]